jgi:phage-related protein
VIITPRVEDLIHEMVTELHLMASKEEEDDDEIRELADALSYLLRRYKNERS